MRFWRGGRFWCGDLSKHAAIWVTGRTRTCKHTVMSGGITIGFVDVAVFLSQSDRVRCASVGSFLVRNRCGHACSCRRVGIDIYRSLSPFRMIIERIDLALSRLKQGFDSPRERQQTLFLHPSHQRDTAHRPTGTGRLRVRRRFGYWGE